MMLRTFLSILKSSVFTQRYVLPYLLICSASIVLLLLLVANPGYFSHDELQKFDEVNRYGLKDYLFRYLKTNPDEFSTFVRPFSFMIQGLLALFMENSIVLVHFFSLLSHAVVACLFYTLILHLGGRPLFGLVAALIFVTNPTSILAVGWSAALMDRLYIFWGLVALIISSQYIRADGSRFMLLWLFCASSLAVLSKETAVILPATLMVFWFVEPKLLTTKRFFTAGVVWALPVLLFIIFRLPTISDSFGEPVVGAYKASIENIPESIFVYFSYPFLVSLTEAGNWIFIETFWLWCGIALHSVLVIALYRKYGILVAIGYVGFYFLFLMPVLFVSIKSAHYLYGSGIVMSAAITSLVLKEGGGRPQLSWLYMGVIITLMLLHSFVLQIFVYKVGTCMNRAMISVESVYLSNGSPSAMDFQAEPGAPEHILHRIFTGREQIGDNYSIKFSISKWGAPSSGQTFAAKMNGECVITRRE